MNRAGNRVEELVRAIVTAPSSIGCRNCLRTLRANSRNSEQAASRGIAGGAMCDAMLTRCASKANAEVIYSWNLRHYALCGDEITLRLRTP